MHTEQRLTASFEIDERQAPMPEGDAVGKVKTLAVRPAMSHDIAHRPQTGFRFPRPRTA